MSTAVVEVEAVPQEITGNVGALEQWAQALVVTSQTEYNAAVDTLKGVKTWRNTIVGFFADSKAKAHSAWKSVLASEQSMTDKLDVVEAQAKRALLTYSQAEEKKRRDEQERLQAELDERARKDREKAEQEAARQRAIEAEQRAKAEAARKEAEAANAAERKKLLAEAEAAERKAAAAAVKVEAKEEQAASIVAPVVELAKAVEKVAGTATRTVWHARVTDVALIPRDWLVPNLPALEAFAKSTKGAMPVLGVSFYSEQILAVARSG